MLETVLPAADRAAFEPYRSRQILESEDEAFQFAYPRTFAIGERLYRAGDPKSQIMRVESGIICVTAPREKGPPEIIELVFPGGFVGLGFLKDQIYSATAVVETKVSTWPLHALSDLCEISSEANECHHTATNREFDHRRIQLEASTVNSPLLRVSAFLAAVSRLNELEGRDPRIIGERPTSVEVADFLSMDLSTLGEALKELQQRELIQRDPSGRLLLLDPARLDDLEGAS